MKGYLLASVVLIAAGVLGLVYGEFSYTKESTEAKLGPIELTVQKKETVNIPAWAGGTSIALGAAILAYGSVVQK